MNKKFFTSWIAVFVVWMAGSFAVHGAFTWIYQRGTEDKPWVQQGLRFGIAIALLAPIPMFTIYYVVQQTPGALAVRQSIGDGLVVIVVALVAAFLNRNDAGT